MRTVIHTGFVSTVAKPNSQYRPFAFASPAFALGEPPITFYVPGGWGYIPFATGDFVAIAGKRTPVPGVQYVALAYRRLGVEGRGRWLGGLLPLFGLMAGLLGLYCIYLGALDEPQGKKLVIYTFVIAAISLYRLASIHAATRQLDQMEMPLTTRSSGP